MKNKKLIKGKRYYINYSKEASGLYMGRIDGAYQFNNIQGEHNLEYYPGTDIIGFGMLHECFQEAK